MKQRTEPPRPSLQPFTSCRRRHHRPRRAATITSALHLVPSPPSSSSPRRHHRSPPSSINFALRLWVRSFCSSNCRHRRPHSIHSYDQPKTKTNFRNRGIATK
ncbi:unnamed protein product [Linum trigynum]|uniref:Uncharacterized protein n=1 Tax=Linum trigynum TaxID=586398 RepID=A0AAV2GIG0_9ROSI